MEDTLMNRWNYPLLLWGLFTLLPLSAQAQNDVMMQAFYWDVPVDAPNLNGSWWDTLSAKAVDMKNANIKAVWTPAPSKGNFGIYDMGYGIFDHYDLGNYTQKGSTETRFGSRTELINMVNALHAQGIDVYADMVLNHIYTDAGQEQSNPAVKQYVFDKAFRNGIQYSPYPTNEIVWRIPNATAGDYYIKINGYFLNCSASYTERAYNLNINWTGAANDPTVYWESEPNNGNGQTNTFPGSGKNIWAHVNTCGDIDEYKVTLTGTANLILKLEARKEVAGTLQWADQTNGYYPFEIWYNGQNLANTTLEARTNTGVSYVTHTGSGEPNYSWTYTDFHPVDQYDWLGFPGNDEVIPNTKFFGNDFNTYSTTVQTRLKDWGTWLTNTVGYDGYRLDFVRGYQETFISDWVKAMPKKGTVQRFTVAEYWTGNGTTIKNWINTVNGQGADIDAFDFPLKFTLKDMTNGNGSSFDMRWLNTAGLIRGSGMTGPQVVTFVENHDTGKEHDKWVTKDWKMAYAYILFSEGRPCLFYPHVYGVRQYDTHDPNLWVQAPTSLKTDIKKLTFARKTYMGGTTAILSADGNPYPSGDAYNVYVARRQGTGTKTGAILVINNHDTATKGLWVNNTTNSAVWPSWANQTLINVIDGTSTTQVYADGRVYVSAPPRGYAVWVPQGEYVAYSGNLAEAETQRLALANPSLGTAAEVPQAFTVVPNYPNPFNPQTTLGFTLPTAGLVTVQVYNVLGQVVATLVDEERAAGTHHVSFDAGSLSSGVYYYTVRWNGQQQTRMMTLMK
jgi:alpha-amylase